MLILLTVLLSGCGSGSSNSGPSNNRIETNTPPRLSASVASNTSFQLNSNQGVGRVIVGVEIVDSDQNVKFISYSVFRPNGEIYDAGTIFMASNETYPVNRLITAQISTGIEGIHTIEVLAEDQLGEKSNKINIPVEIVKP